MGLANDVQIGGNHYRTEGQPQHWDFTWENNYNQFEYCVSKYVYRCWLKAGMQDLQKARHHLAKYIEVADAKPVRDRKPEQVYHWVKNLGLSACQIDILVCLHMKDLYRCALLLDEYIFDNTPKAPS